MTDTTEIPRTDHQGDERATLQSFLTYTRAIAVRLVEGVDDDAARVVRAEPLTSLLGLLKHLTDVERFWFQDAWAGRDLEFGWSDEDIDGEWRIQPHDTVASVVAAYRQATAESDEVLGAGDLDALAAKQVGAAARQVSLRWVGWHLVEETARHNGHLDILRQQIDGLAGIE